MALEETKGQEQITQQVDNGKRRRLNFARSVHAGGSLADIYEASLESGLEPEMPTFEDFSQSFPEIPEEQRMPLYERANQMFDLYNTIEKQTLQTSGYRFPDTEYFKGDQYKKDLLAERSKRNEVILDDRFFHTTSGKRFELYSMDEEATSKGFFEDKNGNLKPLALEKYADNNLMLQMTPNGKTYWKEAGDNEFIPPDLIKGYFGDRVLETKSGWDSIARGLWSGSAPIVAKGIGTAAGVIGSLKDQLFGWEGKPEDRGYYKFNADMQNWANMHSTKNYDEMNSMFNDWNAALHTVSNGVTQLLGIIAAGAVLGGVGGGAARLFGANLPAWVPFQGSLLLGDFEAAAGVQDELMRQGVDFHRSSWYLLPYMAATHVSEMTFGGLAERAGGDMVLRQLGRNKFTNETITKTVNDVVGEAVATTGKALRKMSVAEQKTVVGKVWTTLQNARFAAIESQMSAAASKSAGKRFLSGLNRTTIASFTEGVEEIEEAVMHRWLNMWVNGREAVIGERYVNLHENYNYIPNNPDDPTLGYKRISKTNPTDVTDVTYREYEEHEKNMNHFNDVLAGKKTLDTTFSIEEGVAAFLSTFITFGIGNGTGIMSPPQHKDKALYDMAKFVLKNPQANTKAIRSQIDKLVKMGAFTGIKEDTAKHIDMFMEDLNFSVELLKKIKNDKTVHDALRGNDSLIKRTFMAYREIERSNQAISNLNGVMNELGDNALEADNEALGLKKGDKAADIQKRIEAEEKLLKVSQDNLNWITTPQSKMALSFDDKGKPVRTVTDEQVKYGSPLKVKKTSGAYTDMMFNSLALNYQLNQMAEKEARKRLGLKEGVKSSALTKEIDKILPGIYSRVKMADVNLYQMFSGVRDNFLSALNKYANLQDQEAADLKTVLEETFLRLGNKESVEKGAMNRIDTLLKPIKDIIAGVEKGTNLYDNPDLTYDVVAAMGNLQAGLGEIKKLAGILEPTSETAQQIGSYLSNIDQLGNQLNQNLTESAINAGMEDQLTALTGATDEIRLMLNQPVEGGSTAFTNPTDDDKLAALYLMLDRRMAIESAYQTAIKQDVASIGIPHKVLQTIVDLYRNDLESLKTYIESNVNFVQGSLEATEDNSQHSPLLDNDNARLNKGILDKFGDFIKEQEEKIEIINEKLSDLAGNKSINNFKVESSYINIDHEMLLTWLKFFTPEIGFEGSKELLTLLEAGKSKIQTILDSDLGNGEKVKSIDNLLQYYLKAEAEEKGKIEIKLHEIEKAIIETKESLSGKLDAMITWFNKKAGNLYLLGDPLDTDALVDRKLSTLKERTEEYNNGLLTTKTWADSFHYFFNGSGNSISNIQMKRFFFQHTINTLNEVNQYGQNETPSIMDVIQVARDIVKETPMGDNVNTYEQERMLITIIGFLFSPSNQFLKDGVTQKTIQKSVHHIIDNVLFAKGYGGTGKSTLVVLNTIKAFNRLNDNKKLNVTVIVPSEDLIQTYEENLEGTEKIVGVEYKLLHEVLGKGEVSSQDIVFVDEATVIPTSQRERVSELVKASNSNWIFLGDDVQTTAFKDVSIDPETKERTIFNVNKEEYLLNTMARFTLPLTEVFRARYLQFSQLQDAVRGAKYHFSSDSINEFLDFNLASFKIKQDNTGKIGIQFFSNQVEDPAENRLIQEFIDFNEKYPEQGKDSVLIFLTNEDLENALNRNEALREKHSGQLKTVEYDLIGLIDNPKKANRLVSGLQADAAFVAIDFKKHKLFNSSNPAERVDKKMLLRSFLVATSRQKSYLALPGDPKNSKPIEQELADSEIATYDGNLEFAELHKEYLVGEDGNGGRYSYLLAGREDKPGMKPSKTSADDQEEAFDKTLMLDTTGDDNAAQKVHKETKEFIAKLKKNRARGTRLSDLFWEIEDTLKDQNKLTENELLSIINNEEATESERESATQILSNKKFHKLFNIATNYVLIEANNPKSKKLLALKTEGESIYQFLNDRLSYQYSDPEALFESLVKVISLEPDISLAARNNLAIPAPFLVANVDGNTFVSQPNLINIVGYTTINNQVIPIADLHIFHYRNNNKVFPSDLLHIGGQLALMLQSGMKINNVSVHNFNINWKEKPLTTRHLERITLTEDQIIGALNEANIELGIKGTFAQNDEENEFIFDRTALTSETEFGAQERILSQYKEVMPGLLYVKDGKKATVHSITTQIVNGKRVVMVRLDSKTKIPYEEFKQKYITDSAEGNLTIYNSSANKFADHNLMYATSMISVMDSDMQELLVPSINFFEITGPNRNELLKFRQIMISGLNTQVHSFKLVLHSEPINGIAVDKKDDNIVEKNVSFGNPKAFQYPVSIQFNSDKAIQSTIDKVKGLKDQLTILKEKANLTKMDDVAAFKKMGLDKIGFLGEVEYDYHRSLSKTEFVEQANKYVTSEKMTSEEAKKILGDIFENAFPLTEEQRDDEIAKSSRTNLINLNKARMELLRELYKGDKVVKIRKGNGRAILERENNNIVRKNTPNDIKLNAMKYGFELDTENGKIIYNYDNGGYNDQFRLFAKAWRNNQKSEPVYIFFHGKETMLDDLKDYLTGLEALKENATIINGLKKLKGLERGTADYIETLKTITTQLDHEDFFNFLNNNRNTIMKIIEQDSEFQRLLNPENGWIRFDGSVFNKIDKAIVLVKHMIGSYGAIKDPATGKSYQFFQPVFANEKIDGKRTVIEENLVTAFKTVSQSDMWFHYAPSIALNSEVDRSYNIKTIPLEQALNELRRTLGYVVDSHLFLNDGIFTVDGVELLGRVENSMMILANIDGGIAKRKHKHEAMHFLMLHLLDQDKANEILNETERVMRSKNLSLSENETEKLTQLHEYLAKQYERKSSIPKTLIGKFINWLRRVIAKWTGNKLNQFFAEFDYGMYSNLTYHESNFKQPLNSVKVNNKYTSTEALKNVENIFGSINAVNRIANTRLANKWFSYSPYGMDFSITETNWQQTMRDAIDSLEKDALGIAEKTVWIHDSQGNVTSMSVIEMKEGDYTTASTYFQENPDNIRAKDLYEKFHLGNSNIAQVMFQKLFADINIELIEKGENGDLKEEVAFGVANEIKNPMSSETRFFQPLLGSLQLYDYSDPNKRAIPDRYVNFRLLDIFLIRGYLNAKSEGANVGLSDVANYFKTIIGIDGNPLVSNALVINNIYSFLRYLGEVEDPENVELSLDNNVLKGVGVVTLIENMDDYEDAVDVPKEVFNLKIERLKEFLSLIDKHYNSIKHNIISYVDFQGQQSIIRTQHGISERSIKSGLNDTSDATILTREGDIQPSIKNAFGKIFSINDSTIYKIDDGSMRKMVDLNNSTKTTIDDALFLFEFLGFPGVTKDIVAYLKRDKGWKSTVEGLYDMMDALNTSVLMSDDIDNSLNKNKEKLNGILWRGVTVNAAKKINKRYTQLGYTDTLVDLQNIDKFYKEGIIGEVSKIYAIPSDYWKYIEAKLAVPISFELNNLVSRQYRKATGNMSYAYPLSSWLFDIFPQREDTTSVISKRIKQELSEKGVTKHSLLNSDTNVKDKYNSPILNGRIGIDFIQLFDGIKVVNRSVDYKNMTEFDLIKTMIEGYYINSLANPQRITKLPAFSDIFSSKPAMPIFNWLAKKSNERSFLSSVKGGTEANSLFDLVIDKGFLLDVVYDIARFYDVFKTSGKAVLPLNTKTNPYLAVLSSLRDQNMSNEAKYKKLKKAFEKRFIGFLEVLDKNNYSVPSVTNNSLKWDISDESATAQEKYINKDKWHPLLETVFWSHALLNESLSHLVRGPQAMYGKENTTEVNSVIDYIKRGAGLVAPGYKYSMRNSWNVLPEKSRVLILSDLVVANELFDGKVDATDGASILMPWYHTALKREAGGMLNVIGDGAVKNVNFSYDPVNEDLIYLKFAQFPITKVQYESSNYLKKMVKMGLGEIGNMEYKGSTWNQMFENDYSKASKDFYNWLMTDEGKANRNKLIDYVVYNSAFKAGKRTLATATKSEFNASVIGEATLSPSLNKEDNVMYIPNATLRHQTVTKQDIEDSTASIPSQLLFIIGGLLHNNEMIKEVNNGLAEIIDQANNLLIENIDKKSFFNKIGRKYASNRGMMNKFESLIQDFGTDINIFRNELFSALSAEVRKNANPRLPGTSMVQMVALHSVIEHEGIIYLPNEVKDPDKYTKRGLKPISYDGKGNFRAAEVIAPFHNRAKFGLEKTQTLNQAMTISDGANTVNLNTGYELDQKKRASIIKSRLKGIDFQAAYDNLTTKQKSVIKHANEDSFFNYFMQFNNSLDVLSVRIPTTNASSAFIGRIVAFDYDADNTMFVSSEKNIIDGSDYDIDQLRVFYRNIEYGLGKEDEDVVSFNQNKIFDSLVDYYRNVKNKPMIIQPIDYNNLIKKAEKEMQNRTLHSSDIGSMVTSFGFTMAGVELSGHFPTLENFLFRLWSLTNNKRNSILSDKYKDAFDNDEIQIRLSGQVASLTNAAVDNEKLGGVLGILNINNITSSLISGMIFNGLTEDEMLEVLKRQDVLDAVKEIATDANYTKNYEGYSNTLIKKKRRLFQVLDDVQLKEYAYVGEALRRLRSIINLQREIPATLSEFNTIKNQIEFTLGMSLSAYLGDNTADLSEQFDFVKKNSPIQPESEENEMAIRSVINVQELFNAPELINFKTLLRVIQNMNRMSQQFIVHGNELLKGSFLMKQGITEFRYENDYRDYAQAVDEQLVGLFISDKFNNLSFNGKIYDLSTLKGRFDFISEFPGVVKSLKKSSDISILNNSFIQGTKIGTKFGYNVPIVEFGNSNYLNNGEYIAYQESFKKLDQEVKDAFNAYQLLMNGFNYRNGSMIEVTDTYNERAYSNWIRNVIATKLNNPQFIDEFTDRLIRVSKIAQPVSFSNGKWSFGNRVYGNTVYDNAKTPVLVKNVNGNAVPAFAVGNEIFNSYTEDNVETEYKQFYSVDAHHINELNDPAKRKTTVKLFRNDNVSPRPGYSAISNTIHSGEEVMLPNGQIVQLIADTKYQATLFTLKPVRSSISKEQSAVSYSFIEPFIAKIQESFPNIKINLVSNEEMGEDDTIAWIENGQVYINTDRIQLDTPIHEFIGHIMVDLIQETNPGLYKSLYAEAVSMLNSPDGIRVKQHYAHLSQTDLIRELIANMMGWASEENVLSFLMEAKVEKAVDKSKKLFGWLKGIYNKIRNAIMKWINRAFGTRLNIKNVETASIQDIAKSVVSAIANGDVISYISSKQYAKLQRIAKYKSKIKKDIVKNAQNLHDMLNDKQLSLDERVDNLQTALSLNNKQVYTDNILGKRKQVNPNNRSEIIKAIKEQDEYAKTFTDIIVKNWLSEKGDLLEKVGEKFGTDQHGNLIYHDMHNFIHQIGYDKATKYYKYSDLKDRAELKHLFDESFISETFDPIIAIESASDTHVNISIYDVTPIPVEYEKTKDNILHDLIPNNLRAKNKGILLNKNTVGTRHLMLGLLYNRIMEADSKITVRDVKFIELKKSNSIAHTIDPVVMHKTIAAMGEVDEFVESINNPEMKSIFQNPKHIPKTDYFKTLYTYYNNSDVGINWNYGLRAILNGEQATPRQKYTVLAQRLKAITKGYGGENAESKVHLMDSSTLKEIKYLIGAIFQVTGMLRQDSQVNPFTGLGRIEKMVFDANSIGDENLMELKSIIDVSSARIVSKTKKQQDIISKLYKEAKQIYGSTPMQYMRSVSQDVWDALFVKMKDKNGKEYHNGYIYWTNDENEAKSPVQKEMARQAKSLNIPQSLLDIGRKITDMVEEYVKISMLNSRLNGNTTNSFWNYEQRRAYTMEDIDIENNSMYERGMIPLMARTPGEEFASGKWEDIGGAIGKKARTIVDVYELFDLSLEGADVIQEDFNKLDDIFRFQWGGDGIRLNEQHRTYHGYKGRTFGILGLKSYKDASGKFVTEVVDAKKNKNISKNINLVMDSFILSVLRAEEYENHVLPLMNGLKMYLQDMANHSNDKNMQDKLVQTIDYINLYTKQGIKEERQKFKSGDIAGIDFDSTAMTLMSLTTPAVMTLNFNIGMIGLVTNSMFAFMEGIANQFVERGIYNAEDLLKASGMFFTNMGKVKQLMMDYQVMNMTEQDILRSQYNRVEQKSVFTKFYSNAINWGADFYARGVVMIAQMLHDGSWDAHVFDPETGTIKYDQTKDKRFTSGEKGADEAMIEAVRRDLINDGIWNQEEGKDLVMGYNHRWAKKFKVLADKYVTGAYDSKTKGLMASTILGKMFGMFKTWFQSRYTNAFAKHGYNENIGRYIPKKDVNGNWTAEWDRLETEGYITTMYSLFMHLLGGNVRDWKVTPTRKANIVKWITSVTLFLAVQGLYSVFVKQKEDDDRELAVIPDWRIIRNVRYGISSLMVIPTIIEMASHPFAAVDIVNSWFTDPMGNIKLFGNVPGKTQINTILEPFDIRLEDLYKNEE